MAHNALEAHARDELGIITTNQPHPIQAALDDLLLPDAEGELGENL
jgi:hypothetical protein